MNTTKTIEHTVGRTTKTLITLSKALRLITTCGLLAVGGVSQAQWVGTEIGRATKGAFTATDEVVTMEGVGWDIWNDSDGFYFVHQHVRGDGEFVARLTRHNDSSWAKSAIMLRGSLDAGSKHAMLCFARPHGSDNRIAAFQYRRINGGDSYWEGSSSYWLTSTGEFSPGINNQSIPLWLKLRKSGNTVFASWSSDGVKWYSHMRDGDNRLVPVSANLTFSENVYIGFALSTWALTYESSGGWQLAPALSSKFEEYSHTFSPLTTSVQPTLSVGMYPGLTVSGAVGASYIIEYTQNPATGPWLTADQFVLPSSPWFWVDKTAPGNTRRFYRAVHLR